MSTILAISPLDGRYAKKTQELQSLFSEYALVRNRIRVEIRWLKALCATESIPEARKLTDAEKSCLDKLAASVSLADVQRVKDIERITNHDVKAVEYFIKEWIGDGSLRDVAEWIHFACTSEDINNLAHALMLQDGTKVLAALQAEVCQKLKELAHEFADVPMLACTHGQTASPTTMGKELAVFGHRLQTAMERIQATEICGKLNGAVGNFNAHAIAYPELNWEEFSRQIIEDELQLTQNRFTTQIEPHDYIAELFDAMARFNTILIDLDRDIWTYISMGYFGQQTIAGEVGSSTMPHKVNPIDFENSEGNCGMANAVLRHLAEKLPISRLQRDLSDSTVLRNTGVAYGYSLVAYKSTLKGLAKLVLNPHRLQEDLDQAWAVLAEPIQTVMRKTGIEKPYEKLKELTRGNVITREIIQQFIATLDLPAEDKKRLEQLTPSSYTGLAEELARKL